MSGEKDAVRIRLARLDDAAAIADVHRSHITRWYRQIGDEQHEVGYGSLTLDERCGFGGPWMSPETCAIHLNNLLLRQHTPVVAEKDNRVVAEMELFVGREGRPYGRNCHIGVLYVHRREQRRGIGRRMVEHAIKYARESRCDTLTVASDSACAVFYRKCGFSFQDTLVEVEAAPGKYPVDLSPMPAQISLQAFTWGMSMKIGRLQSSAFHVFEMQDGYALPSASGYRRVRMFANVNGNRSLLSYVILPSGTAEVCAWSAGATASDLAFAALSGLNCREVRAARMLLSKCDYESIDGLVGERMLGSRQTLLVKL